MTPAPSRTDVWMACAFAALSTKFTLAARLLCYNFASALVIVGLGNGARFYRNRRNVKQPEV